MQKLCYVIKNEIMQKYFCFDAGACITRCILGIFISYNINLIRISFKIQWFLSQLHSPKHARVIIIILFINRKAIILAFHSQGVKIYLELLKCMCVM